MRSAPTRKIPGHANFKVSEKVWIQIRGINFISGSGKNIWIHRIRIRHTASLGQEEGEARPGEGGGPGAGEEEAGGGGQEEGGGYQVTAGSGHPRPSPHT